MVAYWRLVRDSDPFVVNEAENFLLSRYGFDHEEDCDAQAFLNDLTDAVRAGLGSEVAVRANPVILPDSVWERCVSHYLREAERNGENPLCPCYDPYGDRLPDGRLRIELYNRRGSLAVYDWTGKRIVRKG